MNIKKILKLFIIIIIHCPEYKLVHLFNNSKYKNKLKGCLQDNP